MSTYVSDERLEQLNLAQNLYGVHDMVREWIDEIAIPSGKSFWGLSVHSIGMDPNNTSNDLPLYNPSSKRIVQIARLNHAYDGHNGTFPQREPYDRYAWGSSPNYINFAKRVARFIVSATKACQAANIKPCYNWILGNEPNLTGERPQGQVITAEMAAELYTIVWKEVHGGTSVHEHAKHRLWVAAVAPYNIDTGDWIKYQLDMMNIIHTTGGITPDAFTGHAYTRGGNPAMVAGSQKMNPPFSDRYSGFRTFEDLLMKGTPHWASQLPFLITEFDEYDAWVDENTGAVKAAYTCVDSWNHLIDTGPVYNPVQGLVMYRYPDIQGDKWGFENKNGVKQDFKEAVNIGYKAPLPTVQSGIRPPVTPPAGNGGGNTWLPSVGNGGAPPVTPGTPGEDQNRPPLVWDPRLTVRGIKLTEYAPKQDGELYYALIKAEFLEEKEHTFVNTVGPGGVQVAGVELRWFWGNGGPSEQEIQKTKDISNDPYALGMANFAMYNAGWSYGLNVLNQPSDQLFGMGLGTPEQPTWKHHRSFRFTYQLVKAQLSQGTAPTPPATGTPTPPVWAPGNQPASPIPVFTYPILGKRYPITSHYGDNPEDYKQFLYDGVPLRGHNGIDIGVPTGNTVLAVDRGTVLEAGADPDKITGGLGNYVKLQHSWGESLYAHLDSINKWITAGITISKDTVVGISGATGNVTGPHLHFAMRIYPYSRTDGMGGFSDPEPYINSAIVKQGSTSNQPETGQGAPSADWAKIWPIVLDIEGNDQISTDRNDTGNYRPDGTFVGTKYGISARAYPNVDIVNLTQEDALALYYRDYWLESGANLLQWPLNLVHFDAYVQNKGAAQKFLLQSGYNCLRYNVLRQNWYTTAPTWEYHGVGWMRRVARINGIVADFFNLALTQPPKS